MGYNKIRIVGKASPKVVDLYKKSFNYDGLQENELLLFCDYSEFDIPVGYQFTGIEDSKSGVQFESKIRLKAVTQQFWKPYDEIPHGWKTICLFEFLSWNVPDIVQALPVIDDWYNSHVNVVFSGNKSN